MTLRLVIQGNRLAAYRRAAALGIPLTLIRESDGETIARTDDAHRAAVEAWFAESPERAPFPTGTLLHFIWEGLT